MTHGALKLSEVQLERREYNGNWLCWFFFFFFVFFLLLYDYCHGYKLTLQNIGVDS